MEAAEALSTAPAGEGEPLLSSSNGELSGNDGSIGQVSIITTYSGVYVTCESDADKPAVVTNIDVVPPAVTITKDISTQRESAGLIVSDVNGKSINITWKRRNKENN